MVAVARFALSDALYHRRETKIRAMMERLELDALIAYGLRAEDQHQNVAYLAGPLVTNTTLFFPARGEPVAFVQPKATVPFAARMARVEVRNGGIDYSDVLADAILGHGLQRGRIGLVEIDSLRTRGIPHLLYRALTQRFPHAEFPTVTEEYEFTRWQLDPEESAWLDRAAADLDRVMDVWVDALRPGVAPADAMTETQVFAREEGLALASLSARGAAMDRSTSIHDPEAAARPLRRGDYVFFESNARYGPFVAYRGFPVCLGEPSGDARTLFETTLELAERATALLRPGGRTSEIAALGEVVEARGLATHGPLTMGNGTGGWQLICERRFEGGYRPPREIIFVPGMTFTAAPHVCLADWSMMAIIGTSVMVEENGPRTLGERGCRYLVK